MYVSAGSFSLSNVDVLQGRNRHHGLVQTPIVRLAGKLVNGTSTRLVR